MTVSATNPYVAYAGAGTSGPFAVPFRFLADADLVVSKIDADGVETILTGNTITGADDDDGGELHTAAAVTAGQTLRIYRDTTRAQTAQYVANGPFPAATHERALDKAMLVDQEQDRDLARALLVPLGEEGLVLPSAEDRASTFLAFDAAGELAPAAAIPYLPVSPFIATLMDDTTAAAARTTLGAASVDLLNVENWITSRPGVALGADCTVGIQAALDEGGLVVIPPGDWMITDTLRVTKRVQIVGFGVQSVLLVGPTFAADKDHIEISPATLSNTDGWQFRNFSIAPASGDFPGRDNIAIKLAVGRFLTNFLFDSIYCHFNGRRAFSLTNPNADGLFCGGIENCFLYGGIELLNSGDRVRVSHNKIVGPNVGIYMEPLIGAAQTIIYDNNITSTGGALHIKGGGQIHIENNQLEQSFDRTGGGSNPALVKIENVDGWTLSNNNMNCYDRVDAIDLRGSSNGMVGAKNVITADSSHGKYHVRGDTTSINNILRDGAYLDYNAGAYAPLISAVTTGFSAEYGNEGGSGAILALDNSWVPSALGSGTIDGLLATRVNGRVTLNGNIKNGSTTGDIRVGNIPAQIRPLGRTLSIPVKVSNAGSISTGYLYLIGNTGDIRVTFLAGNTTIEICGFTYDLTT